MTDDPPLQRVAPIDADVEPTRTAEPRTPLGRIVLTLGSAALLAAMATDALAVAGRHAGIRLFGSIEIVQACIVLIATSAIVLATLVDAHARVHIVLERLSSVTAARLLHGADALSAAVFAWLAAGSIWLSADLWNAFELTEVLQLPLRWLRLAWVLGASIAAVLFARRALRRRAA